MIDTIIAAAAASLRGQYARDVVSGRQRWSGSDLRGKARKYGYSYSVQRRKARAALFAAGGGSCAQAMAANCGLTTAPA